MFYLYTEVKGVFIIYGPGGGGGEPEGGGKKFATYSPGGGGVTFFLAYFWGGAIFFQCIIFAIFFRKNYIPCILILVGALQQYKGMFLKHGRGGAKIFLQCHGGGAIFFPCILGGGGGGFLLAY